MTSKYVVLLFLFDDGESLIHATRQLIYYSSVHIVLDKLLFLFSLSHHKSHWTNVNDFG